MAEALSLKDTPELTLKDWYYTLNSKIPNIERIIAQITSPFDNWTPVFSALAPMNYVNVTPAVARYLQVGNLILYYISASGTTNGVVSSQLRFTPPVPLKKDFVNSAVVGTGFIGTMGGAGLNEMCFAIPQDKFTIRVLRNLAANYTLGTTNFRITGFYETE